MKTFYKKILNPKSHKLKAQSGIAAILTIVIIGAATLIIAYSISVIGLGELEMGYTQGQSQETFSIANSCIEEGLRRLRLDADYSGEALNIGAGSCIMNITGTGSSRTIIATGTIDVYHKKIIATISLDGGSTAVNSWAESDE